MYLIKKRGKIKKIKNVEYNNGYKQNGWEIIKEVPDETTILTEEQREKLALLDKLDTKELKKFIDEQPERNEEVDYSTYKVEDLKELLESKGIEFSSSAKKDELLELTNQLA